MGVAGSGKTTVGQALSAQTGWPFLDADAFHPASNIAKMSAGQALTDRDRRAWVEAISTAVNSVSDETVLLACSALNAVVRTWIVNGVTRPVSWCWLRVEPELAEARVAQRSDHFLPASLVLSQFDALQPPSDALQINASQPVSSVVTAVFRHLDAQPTG